MSAEHHRTKASQLCSFVKVTTVSESLSPHRHTPPNKYICPFVLLSTTSYHDPPPQCLEKECPRGHIRGRREDWNQMNGARVQPARRAHISLPKAWLKWGAVLAGPRQLIPARSDTPGEEETGRRSRLKSRRLAHTSPEGASSMKAFHGSNKSTVYLNVNLISRGSA